ncbi:MAG: xylose isomerase [Alphaproteobacteria bacterium]|nr:MAG: xylose isomerase [Alphaproteobacteria bacterium]
MKTTVTSWSFPQLSLQEIVGLAKVLGLGGVDVGYFYKSALDRRAMISEPEKYAQSLMVLDHKFPCLYHLFGQDLYDRNMADEDSLSDNMNDMRQVIRFCKYLGIEQIMVLPGMVAPGENRRQAFSKAVVNLKEIVPLVTEAGLTISVEPHVHGLLESPALAQELVTEVDGLGLTLDYAHLICLGFSQEEIDVLAPFATHIHLRQARPGRLQEKLDLGTINFNAMLGLLKSLNYNDYVAYEYVHQAYMNTLYDDVITETILMRDLVKAFNVMG